MLILLRELELLLAAALLFGLASLMAVGSSIPGERQSELAALSTWVTIAVDGVGLALLLGASLGRIVPIELLLAFGRSASTRGS